MILVEACVVDREEAVNAVSAGANRLELCVDLVHDGLTPPPALVEEVLGAVAVPVRTMVRPLPGPFTPDPEELARMVAEVAEATALGVHGVVLGALTAAREIDREALARLLDAADGLPMTFHRAFDRVADPRRAWEDLCELGVDRVLTSGGATTAWEGRGLLRELVAAGGPTVLAGGGVRGTHAEELVAATGVGEVHARAAAVPALREALGQLAPDWPGADA